jgi:hypothetical protein
MLWFMPIFPTTLEEKPEKGAVKSQSMEKGNKIPSQ